MFLVWHRNKAFLHYMTLSLWVNNKCRRDGWDKYSCAAGSRWDKRRANCPQIEKNTVRETEGMKKTRWVERDADKQSPVRQTAWSLITSNQDQRLVLRLGFLFFGIATKTIWFRDIFLTSSWTHQCFKLCSISSPMCQIF